MESAQITPYSKDEKFSEARPVDDAEVITDAIDARVDNFKRRLIVAGVILVFAVIITIIIVFTLPASCNPIDDPCCETSGVLFAHLAPLSCYCYGKPKEIRSEEFNMDYFQRAKTLSLDTADGSAAEGKRREV